MIEKEFVLFYNTNLNQYFFVFSKWFELEKYCKVPILYSDDFELIKETYNKLNARLQEERD